MEMNGNCKSINFDGWEFFEDTGEKILGFWKSFGETDESDEWEKYTDTHRVYIIMANYGDWKITGLRGKLKGVGLSGFKYAENVMIFVNTGIADGTLEV